MAATASYNYQHISGAGTFVVHNGSCSLQTIVVNSAGTLCTVYDNTAASGSTIAVINTTSTVGDSMQYNVRCAKGITIVTTGSGTDITVVFGPAQ